MSRLRRCVGAGLVLVAASGCAAGPGEDTGSPSRAVATSGAPGGPGTGGGAAENSGADGPGADGSGLAGPQPIPVTAAVTAQRVRVPAIGVDTTELEALPRGADGELVAPVDFDRAGYYVDGPAPGDPGPAVIAGHVDDTSGPKVFFRLRELVAGDEITVTRSDGADVAFRVDAVEQYPKGAFPTSAVYGPQPGASLRLITCGGSFDDSARSYRDNIVVYASQAPSG